ncbi:neocarzinostatin apoprotein domain-containing protein [Nocardia sp. NPDC050406]|uniref:neocarzinostatin apoprotein domain-containing protein n=1 Tax=Nocardia sp. NPDC050406 TaxID=3364318 RepID=UPI00379859C7
MRKTGLRFGLLLAALVGTLVATAPTAVAAPTLTLDESSGLTPGQTVTVALEGLPPNLPTVAVGQCKPQITLPTDCNLGGSIMGKADAQGKWQPNDGKYVVTLAASIGGVDCTSAPGACTIAVTSLTDASNILASVPLSFGPKQTTTTAAAPDTDTVAEEDEDSGTAIWIAVGAAVVIIAAVVVLLVLRRRGGGTR